MKTLVIDAICGVGFPTLTLSLECERKGVAYFAGDTRAWRWHREALEAQSLEFLQALYESLREAREEARGPSEMTRIAAAVEGSLTCQ
jgi:hypothetical protein